MDKFLARTEEIVGSFEEVSKDRILLVVHILTTGRIFDCRI